MAKSPRALKAAAKSASAPRDSVSHALPLPTTHVIANTVPVRIGGVAMQAASYSERANPAFTPGQGVQSRTALDINVKADYGWAGETAIMLVVHAAIQTPMAPVLVDCKVSIGVAFEREGNTSQEELWSFVKEAGLRVAFPFVRAHIANLTGMGSLGSLLIDPLMLTLEE